MKSIFAGSVLRVYGVIFLVAVIAMTYLTYATFTKKFASYDEVTLLSSKVGLSLPQRADVKIRGVIVGEVLETTTEGDGAKITLGLYRDKTKTVPANVEAQILPKTLFGEKFVDLQTDQLGGDPIKAGDTIDQAEISIELEKVLNDFLPLLRAVRPEDLNKTLTAIANALEGRGGDIGGAIVTLDDYLKRQNPQVPDLVDSLDKLGQTAAVYNSVVPELADILRNSVTTTQTFESNEDEVQALFNDVAGFSDTAKAFLDENGDNMITLANQGGQILPMVARYSPQFKCFAQGLVGQLPALNNSFRNHTLHIVLETLDRQPTGYRANEQPRFNDQRGAFPFCNLMYAAINGRYSQKNKIPNKLVPNINDGVQGGHGKRVAVGDAVNGTEAQKAQLNLAASVVMERPVDQVPDVASLLLAPMTRGMAVNVR